jgi:ribokinase
VPSVCVVGSANMDLVARAERLPRPGETVAGATFARIPGGKGANQAVAAARLGAEVRFVGCVGRDPFAREVLEAMRADAVAPDVVESDEPTGVALIVVDAAGENTIVVAPGANARLRPGDVDVGTADAVLSQLEVPLEAVEEAARQARFFCLNAAPARPVPAELLARVDLLVVNRYELETVGSHRGLVALTLGAEGAVLLDDGQEVARAAPPPVEAVDGTAAGDAFTACLVVSLLERRSREDALRRACAAGAIAASRSGAQPSLPTAEDVDAILAR